MPWLKRRLRITLERITGHDFSSTIPQNKLGFSSSEINLGSPSDQRTLKEIFNNMNITCSDRILDIGCAKGFAINYFLRFPFAKVAGLEISERLVSICENNLNRKGDPRAEVILADATQFDGYGDYNYFYLYNPFPSREILEQVVLKIVLHAADEITIIYNNALNSDVLTDIGFLLQKKIKDPASIEKDVLIFSKKPTVASHSDL